MLLREIVFFIVPLVVAGLVHHLLVIPADLFHALAAPIDGGRTFRHHRLFGDRKTWRGVTVVVVVAAITAAIMHRWLPVSLLVPAWLSGALTGLGYSLGELPNSFWKRQLGVAEGASATGPWRPFFSLLDQTDSVVTAIVALLIIYRPSGLLVASLFVVGTVLHITVDRILHRWSYKRQRLNATG